MENSELKITSNSHQNLSDESVINHQQIISTEIIQGTSRQWKITSDEYDTDDADNDRGSGSSNDDDSDRKSNENSQEENKNENHIVDLAEKSFSNSNESSDNNEEDVDFGMDNYFFSQDFLPERYDRQSQNDYSIRFVSSIQIVVNILLLTGFVYLAVQEGIVLTSSRVLNIALLSIFYLTILFWFNYKLHGLLTSVSLLFINLEVIKRNDKYYSGVEIPDFFIHSREYPPVTILIPVSTESFNNIIRPTVQQCINEVHRYIDETGGKCNILICDDGFNLLSDEEKQVRIAFYTENNIGFIARPHPSKLARSEKCHQAGNLNFALNFSSKYLTEETTTTSADVTALVNATTASESRDISSTQHDSYQTHRDKLITLGTVFHGNTDIGEYILLLTADSRLPNLPQDENGCVKRLVKEMLFDGEQVLYLQCATTPYLSVKSTVEKSVFQHTCNTYNSIMLGTSSRMIAPLLGHNVLLNKKALTQCVEKSTDVSQFYVKQYWSEDHSFEHGELMMRGLRHGFTGRYVSYAGTFQESVSGSYLSEYLKTVSYATNAAESLYNPINNWYRHGILSPVIINLFQSKTVEWYNKLLAVSCILNLLTISGIHIAVLLNFVFCDVFVTNVPYVLLPVTLMWGALFLNIVVTTSIKFMFGMRLNFDKWMYLKQTIRESMLNLCLYGSVSVRMSITFCGHLFNISPSYLNDSLSDAKASEKTLTLVNWTKHTILESFVYLCYSVAVVMRILIFTPLSQQAFVAYYGCLPVIMSIFFFWAGPLMFDILPSTVDKTDQKAYNAENRQFEDKYNTQLVSNSINKKSLTNHSKADMYPDTLSTDAGTDDGSDYSATDSARGWSVSQSNLPTRLETIPEGQEVVLPVPV